MKQAILGGLVAALLTAGAVGLSWRLRSQPPEPETIEQFQHRMFLATTGSGHTGKVSAGPPGKQWVGYNPWYREGALQVHAAQAGIHGAPRGPVFLLLLRLAPHAPYSLGGTLSSDGRSLEIGVSQYSSDGKPFPVVWRAEGVPEILTTTPVTPPFKESLTVGGKPYPLDKGRVFLIDLSATPPAVTQVDGDLVELFKNAEDEITAKELKGIVERLAALERPVEAFLEAIPKP